MNIKLLILAASAAVVVVGGVVAWASLTQKEVDKAQATATAAKQEAAGAKLQADVSDGIAKAVDVVVKRDRSITSEVSRATQSVRLALGDGAKVEPVLTAWRSGIVRVRNAYAAPDAGGAGDSGPAIDRRAVSASAAAGDASARLVGHRPTGGDAGPVDAHRLGLRGRFDGAVECLCRPRPVDRDAV